MVAYLGLPIVDSEGSPFGTVCTLDNKEHVFSEIIMELLAAIKQSFEVQLQQLHFQHIEDEKQQLLLLRHIFCFIFTASVSLLLDVTLFEMNEQNLTAKTQQT